MEISEVYQKNKESDRQCKDCVYYVENYEDDFTIRNFGYGGMVNRPACSFGGTYGFVSHNPARTCTHYKKSESEGNQMIEEKESPEHDRYEYYCNGINITNCKWLRVDPIPHCGIDSARSCTLECSHYESFVAEQSKSSEGIKYDSGKPRLGEMVVDFRKPLVEVAKVWAFGADKYAEDFIFKALELTKNKVAMLLRIQFLEGIKRYDTLFTKKPPKVSYVFSSRIGCAMNGEFGSHSNTAVCYAWFVWEKDYTGETIIRWIKENKDGGLDL